MQKMSLKLLVKCIIKDLYSYFLPKIKFVIKELFLKPKHTMDATRGIKIDAVAILLENSVNPVTKRQVKMTNIQFGKSFKSDNLLLITRDKPLFSTPKIVIECLYSWNHRHGFVDGIITFSHCIPPT